MTTIRRYLHAWASEGPARASRYLVTSQRATSDRGSPRISAGTVASSSLYSWTGPNEFMLTVSMNLAFTSDPMGWNRGINDRFVTVRREGRNQGYLLEFATSP